MLTLPLTSDTGSTATLKNGKEKVKKQFQQWVFTLNNYTDEEVSELEQMTCRYLCFGREIAPTTGTPHLQGFVHFSSRKTLKQVKQLVGVRAYLHPQCGSNKSNVTYCGKDANPFIKGKLISQGHRSDLDHVVDMVRCKKSIVEIADECPSTFVKYNKGIERLMQVVSPKRGDDDVPMVIWIHGKAGAGKTRLAKEIIGEEEYYIKDNTKWWDGYWGEKIVLIDDFRHNEYDFVALLRLCDRGQYRVQVKCAYVQVLALVVIITCPDPPERYWAFNDLDQIKRRITKVIAL